MSDDRLTRAAHAVAADLAREIERRQVTDRAQLAALGSTTPPQWQRLHAALCALCDALDDGGSLIGAVVGHDHAYRARDYAYAGHVAAAALELGRAFDPLDRHGSPAVCAALAIATEIVREGVTP